MSQAPALLPAGHAGALIDCWNPWQWLLAQPAPGVLGPTPASGRASALPRHRAAVRVPQSTLTISVAEGEPISVEFSFNGSPTVGNPFYKIMTQQNLSERILAFRMTRPNISDPVSITEGHFRGEIEFEKNTSSLFIPEVWVNDSGLYYCEVITFQASSRTNGTYLIVLGKCLSFSLSPASLSLSVTLVTVLNLNVFVEYCHDKITDFKNRFSDLFYFLIIH
uniref:Immunoglobulin V-set domain-containing protein n=1 Tax=Pelusios castaneus TaxID=367368 RepID=A0A8C8RX22_9SAUR